MHLQAKTSGGGPAPGSGHFRYGWIVSILVVTLVGAWFRLVGLGDSAFRADTIMFYDLCHQPVSAWAIMAKWLDLTGRSGQLPFMLAFTKGFIDVFHLPVTDFAIRFPSALFGLLTIPVACCVGRLFYGKRFGLFVGLLLAVNPFHIQTSREAYFYTPLILGSAMLLWGLAWMFRHRRRHSRYPWYVFATMGTGYFLAIYSQFTGWWIGALSVMAALAMAGREVLYAKSDRRNLVILIILFVVIGLPLLFVNWGVPYLLYDLKHPEIKENLIRVFGGSSESLLSMLYQGMTGLLWGATPWRVFFGGGALIAGGVSMVLWKRGCRILWIPLFLIVGGIFIFYLASRTSQTHFSVRYFSFIFIMILVFMASGIWNLSRFSILRRFLAPRWRRHLVWIVSAAAVGLCLQPAIWSLQLPGKPIPYKAVIAWFNATMKPGSLVLVDRWLDPWNELRVHHSTNVYFTFTIPNEPVDVYLKYRWRDTARAFFEKFPDAAYFEVAKSYWENPAVGPWPWPREYFKRHVAISNEPALKLRALGLLNRNTGVVYTNGLIVEIFYNTRDDLCEKAAREGRHVMALYGSGWKYAKLWQQYRDFRDWRVLEDQAHVDIFNLTSTAVQAVVSFRAMAVNGNKRVQAGTGFHDFKNGLLEEWRVGPLTLQPGQTSLSMNDVLWKMSQVPLLVESLQVASHPQESPAPK